MGNEAGALCVSGGQIGVLSEIGRTLFKMQQPPFRTTHMPVILKVSLLTFWMPAAAFAGTSAHYSITPATVDAGGGRSVSANYANEGSIGGFAAGISSSANVSSKSGFIGQLYEVSGLAISALSPLLNETFTMAMTARLILDDSSTLRLEPSAVTWSVLSGPLTLPGVPGLATAGTVFQNTAATVQGVYGSFTATLPLTVRNVNLDDFGSYAGDGLDDAWQNQFFGLDNPLAAPLADPDGDGQSNAFEFAAGVVPTDSASRFVLTIEPVPNEPGQKKLTFSPRLNGRVYTITATSNLLGGSYEPLAYPGEPADIGLQRSIIDSEPSGEAKWYRVEITKP